MGAKFHVPLVDGRLPELRERTDIRAATRRLDPARLTAFPVSTRVNRPENDEISLLDPLD